MMRPVELFSPCPRIGLLDAFEVLAWEKTTFPRAVYLLATLSEWSAEDNYGSTPMRSLRAIFRCRMPQTSADAEMRLVVLKRLLKDYPKVGWELSLLQVVPMQATTISLGGVTVRRDTGNRRRASRH